MRAYVYSHVRVFTLPCVHTSVYTHFHVLYLHVFTLTCTHTYVNMGTRRVYCIKLFFSTFGIETWS